MALRAPLEIILGAGNIGDTSLDPIARFDTSAEVKSLLDVFYDRGYRKIDTSRGYSPHAPGTSESRLGAVDAALRFTIDTKVLSKSPGDHTKENIAKSIDESLADLKVEQVDVMYLHSPDRTVPFEETHEAIDKAFRDGKFKRFGLSNYAANEVQQFIDMAEKCGFVKPTVYQGQYNPIVRGAERELLPLLRKHDIAFYAWSPAGAGFFAGRYKNIHPGDRFDPAHRLGTIYSNFYLKPSIEAATDHAREVAAKHSINGHAAALRWTVYHSSLSDQIGDGVIIGASSPEQLGSNLDMIKEGLLPKQVVDALEVVYKEIAGTEAEVSYHF